MPENISGFNTEIDLISSVTYPNGINLTQFPEDTDAIDSPSIQIANARMGLNGDLIVNSVANPIEASISLIANSDDDFLLGRLFEANRAARGKNVAYDLIDLTLYLPNGDTTTLINGVITDGMPMNSITVDSGLKTKTYTFKFENKAFA